MLNKRQQLRLVYIKSLKIKLNSHNDYFLLVTIYLCSNFYSNNVLEIHTNIVNSIYLDSVVVVPAGFKQVQRNAETRKS